MRLSLPLLILLAPLWASDNPLRAQIPHVVPDVEGGDSRSIAESGPGAGAYRPHEPAESSARPAYAYKSGRVALGLSVLGAAVPVLLGIRMSGHGNLAGGLVVGGLLVGPSSGQFYAGSPGAGILGTAIRTGGYAMFVLGFVYAVDNLFCSATDDHNCDSGKDAAAAPLLILGTATYLGGAIFSMLDAGWAVERYNARVDKKRIFGWSPTVAPGPQGGLKPGAMAWMRF